MGSELIRRHTIHLSSHIHVVTVTEKKKRLVWIATRLVLHWLNATWTLLQRKGFADLVCSRGNKIPWGLQQGLCCEAVSATWTFVAKKGIWGSNLQSWEKNYSSVTTTSLVFQSTKRNTNSVAKKWIWGFSCSRRKKPLDGDWNKDRVVKRQAQHEACCKGPRAHDERSDGCPRLHPTASRAVDLLGRAASPLISFWFFTWYVLTKRRNWESGHKIDPK